jgi:hypothetical protein
LAGAATRHVAGGRFHREEQVGARSDRRGWIVLNPATDGALDRRQAWADAMRGGLALAGAAAIAAWSLGIAQDDVAPSIRVVTVATLPALLAPLFGRDADGTPGTLGGSVATWLLATLLLTGLAALASGAALPVTRLPAPLLVALGVVLTAALATAAASRGLQIAGAPRETAQEWSRWLVVAALWLLAAAPLWLGPLADLGASTGPGLAEAIVTASPLVHVAVAAGQDLVRTQWFYAHTSLGALPFEYPALPVIAFGYVAAAVILAAVCFLLSRPDSGGSAPDRTSRTPPKEHAP